MENGVTFTTWMNEMETWMSSISTVILAFLTAIYVYLTHKLLRNNIQEKQNRIRSALLCLLSELSMNEQIDNDSGNEAPRLSTAYDSCFWAMMEIGASKNTIDSVCRAYVHINWHKVAYENLPGSGNAIVLAANKLKSSIPAAIKAMRDDTAIKDIV